MRKNLYGISYDSNLTNIDIDTAMQIYKKLGFKFVAFDWSRKMEDNMKIINSAKKYNLAIDDIHLLFDGANKLWINNDNNFINYVKKSIDKISSINGIYKNVILHITRKTNPPEFNEIGVNNILNIVDYGHSKGVNILLENLRRPDYLENLFNYRAFDICLDIGHANLYMDDYFAFIDKYKDYIKTTHIHDNNKDIDSHNSLYTGSINWEQTISALKKTAIDKTKKYHLEIFPKDNTLTATEFESFLNYNITELRKLVE